MTKYNRLSAALLATALLAGCGGSGNWQISREDPESVADLDYRFDEDDARQIAAGLVADALSKPWLDEWFGAHEGRPLIVLGNVKNDTEDYINTDLFTDPIQEGLLNSGRVRAKAQRDLRAELREERFDTEFNDPATVKAAAIEVNADFMLLGRVKGQKERSKDGKKLISYYQVTLELISIETAEKVWMDTQDIEKRAKRR